MNESEHAALEAFLARLYTDAALLDRFLGDAAATCSTEGLADAPTAALVRLAATDRDGLVLAARSYAAKRAGR